MSERAKLGALLAFPLLLYGIAADSPESVALDWLETHRAEITALADSLWEHAEPAHREYRTAQLVAARLDEGGFRVEREVAGLPTALVAVRGSGRPVIGIVALLDALPGLSQEAEALERRPLPAQAAGHGCGHHLIAAANTAAAIALAQALEKSRLPGTIKLFGAPAEEIYHGGVFMARAGLFEGLDALLFWHPSSVTTVIARSGLAMESVKLVFHGLASDATDAADKGRNALTALERTVAAVAAAAKGWPAPVVVNHVIEPGAGIPSVVPEHAAAWYFIHARDLAAVESARRQVAEMAARAAAETGTRFQLQLLSRTNHWLINRRFAQELHRQLGRDQVIQYTRAELDAAAALRATLEPGAEPNFRSTLLPLEFSDEPVPISDDTAEASWLAPRAGFLVACFPAGLPSHSWQWTAAGKSSFAHKGMLRAARTLARTALGLVTNPAAVAAIREEFDTDRRRQGYQSPLPEDLNPFEYIRPFQREAIQRP